MRLRSWLQHHLNPLHLFCRFKDWGLPERCCKLLSKFCGKVSQPLIYPRRKQYPQRKL